MVEIDDDHELWVGWQESAGVQKSDSTNNSFFCAAALLPLPPLPLLLIILIQSVI